MYIEDYYIHKYLWNNKHLQGRFGFSIYLQKLENIMYHYDVNHDVRIKVLKVWNKYKLFNKYTMALCWRIIKK